MNLDFCHMDDESPVEMVHDHSNSAVVDALSLRESTLDEDSVDMTPVSPEDVSVSTFASEKSSFGSRNLPLLASLETAICDLNSAEPARRFEAVRCGVDAFSTADDSMVSKDLGNPTTSIYCALPGRPERLIELLSDEASPICVEVVCILGSLAKGSRQHVAFVVAAGCVPRLLKAVASFDLKLSEASLRCLRSIFVSDCSPIQELYDDPKVIPSLFAALPRTLCTQECVATIFAHCCLNEASQNALIANRAFEHLAPLLISNSTKIQLPALRCYAALCYRNGEASRLLAATQFEGRSLLETFVELMNRNRSLEMQIAAAKCLTYVCRSGVLKEEDDIIMLKVMPTLVRGCKHEIYESPSLRVEATQALAYLIEDSIELQRITATNNHCLSTLGRCLNHTVPSRQAYADIGKFNEDSAFSEDLRKAAMKAIASITSCDEEIRRKVVNTEVPKLFDYIMEGISPPNEQTRNLKVQLAALRCLHSLSRSVEQLRTSFHDRNVWKPCLELVKTGDEDLAAAASAVLANLLVDFSPHRTALLEAGVIDVLVQFIKRTEEPMLRLNAIWGLMNVAYKADVSVKVQILNNLRMEDLLRLLTEATIDAPIAIRILGLMRNLLSTRPHVDSIMQGHGSHVMQAIIYVLEEDYAQDVKELALSILSNMADGDTAKDFIMSNEDILRKISSYMTHQNVRLQTVATCCVCNLAWKEDTGSQERQQRLKELGIQKILQQQVSTTDTFLFDKVRYTMQQFSL